MKKNILLFSRCELAYLYGSLDSYLDEFNVYHVAYSDVEETILKKDFNISNIINFKRICLKLVSQVKLNDELLLNLDIMFRKYTSDVFNLNNALQADRTFKYISYNDSLKTTVLFCNVWEYIFNKIEGTINYFIHEPVSLMMNFVASVLCKKQGGIYTTHIMVKGVDPMNFIMIEDLGKANELKTMYNTYMSEKNLDISNEIKFLNDFRKSYDVFFNIKSIDKPKYKLLKSLIKQSIKNLIIPKKSSNNIVDSIDIFIKKDNSAKKKLKNLLSYRKIIYDNLDEKDQFYFYPIHLEPEAVVLYWAGNYYTNQVKLIENIAAQLPPNVFLYVKDHPHDIGYRDVEDYKKIQAIPNVKLLSPELSGKAIINKSIGVITINGTAGFEALLLNKHVIVFGNAFYDCCERVKKIENIKDLQKTLYDIQNVNYEDDIVLFCFIKAYLSAQKKGFTDFFGGTHLKINIDVEENSKIAAKGLIPYFK